MKMCFVYFSLTDHHYRIQKEAKGFKLPAKIVGVHPWQYSPPLATPRLGQEQIQNKILDPSLDHCLYLFNLSFYLANCFSVLKLSL